jgi:RNA polymerase sigma factor (sigma-70 family)
VTSHVDLEDLLRRLTPQVLAALLRRNADFESAEDAVQEALLAAATTWPEQGIPDRPDGWLITVASRRLIDQIRSESAGRRREHEDAARIPADQFIAPAADEAGTGDDTLILLVLCCHPSLTPSTQVALTLRVVGGLRTAEVARAFLVPEPSMRQRLSRAKRTIKDAGGRFRLPAEPELTERLRSVLHVLYLMFNEGYTATSGHDLHRAELTGEALRITRTVRGLRPDDGEVAGLYALMLLIEARRAARTGSDGGLIPLAEQDRSRWNQAMIAEGVEVLADTLANHQTGPYQLQAAIAAVHAEAPRAADTDWTQIVGLYQVLTKIAPSPVVTLNHAVAVAMLHGPQPGLAMLAALDADQRVARQHRLPAIRAHLLEQLGDRAAAVASYRRAAQLTTSIPEQNYLQDRADRLERLMFTSTH